MAERSIIVKNKILALKSTLLYLSLLVFIISSVTFESFKFLLISAANFLELYNFLIIVSSISICKISLFYSLSNLRFEFSILKSSFLSLAFLRTISIFFAKDLDFLDLLNWLTFNLQVLME